MSDDRTRAVELCGFLLRVAVPDALESVGFGEHAATFACPRPDVRACQRVLGALNQPLREAGAAARLQAGTARDRRDAEDHLARAHRILQVHRLVVGCGRMLRAASGCDAFEDPRAWHVVLGECLQQVHNAADCSRQTPAGLAVAMVARGVPVRDAEAALLVATGALT